MRSALRRAVAALGVVVVTAALLTPFAAAPTAQAAVASDFDPGNIIADSVFYNPAAMDEGQIQSFLDATVPPCSSGYVCLDDYRQTTSSRAADGRCAGYSGAPDERASRIIARVAQSCGINPQVLLTLLQKEQSLVTLSAPSESRYRIATGYACPDTAPCDAAYYGFFNQLYSAARQYQVYRTSPNSFNYRAGRWNSILWHPNAACGRSDVYIQNQATAGLYNYTPYRPNAAALANMYGTGDGCSSYGNRNFFRIFTDWFGSTQGSYFVRTASDSTVFLITSSRKYPVPNGDVQGNLSSFGPVRVVTAELLASLTTGPLLGPLVRDPATGDIFLVTANTRYRFPTCELVTAYGLDCSQAADLDPGQLSKLPRGADVTVFAQVPGLATLYHMVGGSKRPIYDVQSYWSLAGSAGASAITPIQWWLAGKVPTGGIEIGPGRVVKSASKPELWLIDGASQRIHIASYDMLVGIGASGYATVPDSLLAAYPARSDTLGTPMIVCGDRRYVAGGRLLETSRTDGWGLPSTTLDPTTCAGLPHTSSVFGDKLFARDAGGTIYLVDGSTKRPIFNMASFYTLFGSGKPAAFAQLPQSVLATWPIGAPVVGPATLIRTAADERVYLVDGAGAKKWVRTLSSTASIGVTSGIAWVPDSIANALTTSGELADSPMIRCGEQNYVGNGANGLVPTSRSDGYGLPVTTLDPATCAGLRRGTTSLGADLFIRSSSGAIYLVADAATKRPIVDWTGLQALTGAAKPIVWAEPGDVYLGRWASGAPVYGPGTLVRDTAGGRVLFVDGLSQMRAVASPDVAWDAGAPTAVTSAGSLSGYTVAAQPLTSSLVCGGGAFVGASGGIRAWTGADHGIAATTLDPRSCAALPKGIAGSGKLFLRTAEDSTVWYITGGVRRKVPDWATLVAVAGTSAPIVLYVRAGTISAIPAGSPL